MCDGCHKKSLPTTGAVISGTYGQFCSECRNKLQRLPDARSAQYFRDRDRDAHEADLIQPWDSHGNPNKEFIRMYPDEAKDNFTEEELNKFG